MTAPVRIGMSYPVVAPNAEPPPFGLTSVARTPNDGNERWMAGYTYRPDLPGAMARNRSMVTDTLGTNVVDGLDRENVEVHPWVLSIEDEISTFERATEDPEARAKRLLDYYTSRLLEHELWFGEVASADGLPNRYFTDGSAETVTGSFTDPKSAVAKTVQALNNAGVSSCMVHVPLSVGIQLPADWTNEYTWDRFGFVTCVGAGYPDTGTIYATDLVNVRLGDIEVEGGTEAVNIYDNTIRHYAKRVGAADFAGPVLACTITAPVGG